MTASPVQSPLQPRPIWKIALQGLADGGPSVCQFAITSACNARCGFCNFAVDRSPPESRQSVTLAQANQAADILHRNGVHYLIFVGGEPLMHPDLPAMIRYAAELGMAPLLVTNGALLTEQRIQTLAEAGVRSVILSIDAHEIAVHETNRGLPGVCDRIRAANQQFKHLKIGTTASVTMSRLIEDYQALPEFLKSLGFDSVTFSYPLTTLASSYLGYAESDLVSYEPKELEAAFETVKALKKQFHVVNPSTSIEDMQRHLRGETEQFGCLGGWKYFYLDWHLNLYRCHNWAEPLCHITEFDGSQRVRDNCTACMLDCYRDASVMQYIGIAISDGWRSARKGRFREAWNTWFSVKTKASLQAVWEEGQWMFRL